MKFVIVRSIPYRNGSDDMSLNAYNLPIFLRIEKNCLKDIVQIIESSEIKCKKILLICGNIVYSLYGEIVFNNLKREFRYVNKKIIYDNRIKTAMEISEYIINEEIDCIVGVGGGKVLDMCKYISHIVKKRFISIPTAIAHDGIASPIAVLTTKEGVNKSLACNVPSGIVIDIDIIMKSPVSLIKSGIGDILSNYTAIYDWKLAEKRRLDKVNEFSSLLASAATTSIVNFGDKNINNEKFIIQLSESIILSGMAMEIADSSRPCSGSEHLFSHTLDKYASNKNLHGLQVALGAIISSYLQGSDYKELINFLHEFYIDVNPIMLGITIDEFIYCMQNARLMKPNRYTILNEADLSKKTLSHLYTIMCEEVKL